MGEGGKGRAACVLIAGPTHAEGGCQRLVNDEEEEHQMRACHAPVRDKTGRAALHGEMGKTRDNATVRHNGGHASLSATRMRHHLHGACRFGDPRVAGKTTLINFLLVSGVGSR